MSFAIMSDAENFPDERVHNSKPVRHPPDALFDTHAHSNTGPDTSTVPIVEGVPDAFLFAWNN
jgi:hypothetical protein